MHWQVRAGARTLISALFLAGWGASTADAWVGSSAIEPPTTVIILRHAERLSDDKDTPLSVAGQARARALVPVLTALKPDVVIISELQRTRQTAAPFLEKTRLVPLVRNNEKCADLAAEILKEWRGKTALVVWHRGPHVDLAKALGTKGPFPEWTHDTYDRYWIIRVTADGLASLAEQVQPPIKERLPSLISK